MGIVIEYKGNSFWEPSQRVGRLFVNTTSAIADIYKIESGINEYMDDTFDIEEKKFRNFTIFLSEHFNKSDNIIEKQLIVGGLVFLLAIFSYLFDDEIVDNIQVHQKEIELVKSSFNFK
jgi:hypothetical protein